VENLPESLARASTLAKTRRGRKEGGQTSGETSSIFSLEGEENSQLMVVKSDASSRSLLWLSGKWRRSSTSSCAGEHIKTSGGDFFSPTNPARPLLSLRYPSMGLLTPVEEEDVSLYTLRRPNEYRKAFVRVIFPAIKSPALPWRKTKTPSSSRSPPAACSQANPFLIHSVISYAKREEKGEARLPPPSPHHHPRLNFDSLITAFLSVIIVIFSCRY